jgi:MOSC domain-containing protein YiiM
MDKPSGITIECQFIGMPKVYESLDGPWESSIGKTRTPGLVELTENGFAGNQVADTKNHGSKDQAVSCHSMSHYDYWNQYFSILGTKSELQLGSLGENWTLSNCDESDTYIGDIYEVGSTIVQVSQPRTPCWKQEAKTGISGLIDQTIFTLRTGFYLRVLQPGQTKESDSLILKARPNPDVSIKDITDFRFHGNNIELARRMVGIPELSEGWRHSILRKLQSY